jgi:hypothetical protein
VLLTRAEGESRGEFIARVIARAPKPKPGSEMADFLAQMLPPIHRRAEHDAA